MLAEIFGVDGLVVGLVVLVVLFGGAAIPKLARNLGSAKNQFEKGLSDGKKSTALNMPQAGVDEVAAVNPVTVAS